MALMRAAPNWISFRRFLNRAFRKLNVTIPPRLIIKKKGETNE